MNPEIKSSSEAGSYNPQDRPSTSNANLEDEEAESQRRSRRPRTDQDW